MKNTVLIIEDDKDTLEILAYLAEQLNIHVVPHSNVLSLSEIEALSPSVVLLDHWINGKLGGSLCHEIKSNPSTAHIPVVMISAHTDIEKIAESSGANSYLTKPFDIDELTNLIGKYVN